jgi:hypothetical protein
VFTIKLFSSCKSDMILLINSVFLYSEMTKTMQVLNEASWQETFKALWISALRLVQRVNRHSYDNYDL